MTSSSFQKQTAVILDSTSGFEIDLFVVIGMSFCISKRNSSESDHQPRSYDCIAAFKMAAASHVARCICFRIMLELTVLPWSSNFDLLQSIVSEILRF